MTAVIHASDLTKIFGKSTAVDHVSFEVQKGEIFGFLGPNGAGKTTTTRMLTGVIPLDAGTATILGYDIRSEPVQAKQRFGVVPETSNAYTDLTAWQNLMLMGELYGLPRTRSEQRSSDLLGMVGLLERKDQKVQAYSKGMKQRIGLALAMIHSPATLILDEPMSGLDPIGRNLLKNIILDLKNRGKTIFFSTHILNDVETLCDRIGMIHQGQMLYCGDIGGFRENGMGFEECFMHRIQTATDGSH